MHDNPRYSETLSGFQNRQNISCRVFEPGDGWAIAARNSSRVRLQIGLVITFKPDAALAEFVYGFLDVVYRKIQNRECGWLVVGLWIDQSLGLAENQRALRSARNFEPERIAVKVFGLLNVIHRKTADSFIGV